MAIERIIYAIPFTSIIDQTAAIFRDVLGDDFVLEHHSAIDEDEVRSATAKATRQAEARHGGLGGPGRRHDQRPVLREPVRSRPSRCRKLHNIARQRHHPRRGADDPAARSCARPSRALDELARNYGCTIVLCTATQPALTAPEFKGGLPLAGRELAPDPAQLARGAQAGDARACSAPWTTRRWSRRLAVSAGLVIVNSRGHALALYSAAKAAGLDGLVHLTTRQYAAHRREILAGVRTAPQGRTRPAG